MTLRPLARLLFSLALVFLCLGAYENVRAQRKRAARAPRRPAPAAEDARATPHVEEGLRLSEAGDWEGAIKAFRQAAALSPRHPEAHIHLGDAYMSAGRYEEAFNSYRQAVHVAPWNPDAHYSLGAAYNDMAQYGDAFKPFVQAIQLDPSYAEAYFGIGYAYQKLDNYREALGYLRSALRLRPDYPEARLSLGLTYAGLGDFKAAEEQLRQLESSDAALAKILKGELQRAAADAAAQGDVRRQLPETASTAAPPQPRPTPAAEKPPAPEKQSQAAPRPRPVPAQAGGGGPRRVSQPAVNSKPGANSIAVELAFWDSIKNSTDPEEFAAYLKRFPDGQFSDLARIRQRALTGRPAEAQADKIPAAEVAAAVSATPAASIPSSSAAPREPATAPAQVAAQPPPSTNPTPAEAAPTPTPQREPATPAPAASATGATPSTTTSTTTPANAAPAAPPPAERAEPSTTGGGVPASPSPPAPASVARPAEPARPPTLEETLEWLRQNFSNRFAYRYTVRGEGAAGSTHEASVSYEPVLFQGCNLEWRDAGDTLAVSLSELDPQGLRVEPRAEPNTTFNSEVWNLVVTATGGARAFREVKGDGSGAMNSYHAVTLQFDSRERAERLAEKLRHAVKLCGGQSTTF